MHRRKPLPPEQAEVRARFFIALNMLISGETKVMRGKATFCRRYDVCRRKLWRMEQFPSYGIFDPALLVYLVRDFGVSADWLLTGRGQPLPGHDAPPVNCVNNSEANCSELAT